MSAGPTVHHLRAAITVARIIDEAGDRGRDVRGSYPHVLTAGEHSITSLAAGEALLLQLGLVIERHGWLHPTKALTVLTQLEDLDAEDALRAAHARADEDLRNVIGDAGEVVVVASCREDLESLGRKDLAHHVQQMSLLNDGLGYDVLAPSITGPNRLMEVKTSGRKTPGTFEFYLTRNEYEVGRRNPNAWSLVACDWNKGQATLVGWCKAAVLTTHLPEDGNGRWTEALVRLPRSLFTRRLPPPV